MHQVGIIGVGDFGSFVVGSFKYLNNFKLAAVCDLNTKLKFSRSVKFYSDYKELLSDKNIGVVYIATESFSHVKIAIEALKSGKAVLCEKPLFVTETESEHIRQAVSESKKPFRVNFVLPNNPFYKEALKILSEGKLGNLIFIEVKNLASESIKTKDWYHDENLSGGWFATSDIHFFHLLELAGLSSPNILEVFKHKKNKRIISTYCLLRKGDIPVSIYHQMNKTKREKCLVKFYFESGEMEIRGWVPHFFKITSQNQIKNFASKDWKTDYLKMVARNFELLFSNSKEAKENFEMATRANLLALKANHLDGKHGKNKN